MFDETSYCTELSCQTKDCHWTLMSQYKVTYVLYIIYMQFAFTYFSRDAKVRLAPFTMALQRFDPRLPEWSICRHWCTYPVQKNLRKCFKIPST